MDRMHTAKSTRRTLGLVVALTMASLASGLSLPASVVASSGDPAKAQPSSQTQPSGLSKQRLHVKFVEGTGVRLRGGRLVSLTGSDVSGFDAIVNSLEGAKVERLFVAAEESLRKERNQAERNSGRKLPDLNLWFRLRLPDGTDDQAVLRQLNALSVVETAYAEPLPAPTPATPDLSGYQHYLKAAPVGINAGAGAGVTGGNGERVQIIDLEYSWNTSHEDLHRAANGLIANGTPRDPFNDTNHGSAVIGELIAGNNGFGVTGIVPGAVMGMVNVNNAERGYDLNNALALAASRLNPGDIILIEQHFDLSNDQSGDYVPAEYFRAYFDTISTITNAGIIVVEAAGNGNNDLDAMGVTADSGAIMVGAGEAPDCGSGPARSRAWFSNYGSRVDVQGWGECVATTGYANLYNGGYNAWYTAGFSGTSSASPIVTGAAAILSSVIEARTGRAATPSEIRNLLKSTGTAQDFSTGARSGRIGPMPDVARALAQLGTTGGDTTPPTVSIPAATPANGYKVTTGKLVPTKISWTGTDASGIARYSLKVSVNGGAWTDVTLPSVAATKVVLNLTPGNSYRFTVAAQDGVGLWSSWSTSARVQPALIGESHSSVSYSGGWNSAAWASAVGGYLNVSGTPGAYAKVTFTGRSISWVGTMATNRGEAKVWLDQTFLGTFDLYRLTTAARTLLVTRNVDPSVAHTLTIQVVGTADRPKIDVDAFVILR